MALKKPKTPNTTRMNVVYHNDWMKNELADKSVQLIIADPPYFEVKGEFDFIWKTFDEYLQQVELWAKECKRLLADNGTLFWYGDRKKIAYSQIILDKYFNLENSIYLQSVKHLMVEQFDTLRSFYELGFERVLMYSNEFIEDVNNFINLRRYFIELKVFINKGEKELREILGHGGAIHCFRINGNWDFPTSETYNQLIEICKINTWSGYVKYETLRDEYETLRRPFNNYLKLQDNWYFTKGNSNDFDHETVKSEKQTRAIILTCSRPNDLVFVPFAGSGTECAMALREGRNTIGFDINEKYVAIANKRIELVKSKPQLF